MADNTSIASFGGFGQRQDFLKPKNGFSRTTNLV